MQPDGGPLGGRYELTALIATGGMGQVWRARDTVLNREVAVKVLRSEYTGDPTFLARFRAEAQLAAGLVHPNIATLFDYGEVLPQGPTGEHLAYLVMELVRGESLSGLLRREHRLGADRTLDVLRQSAAGLAAAHAAGVVHRDVKPGNVLLGSDGTVKITDFGVAVSAASVPLTKTGQVIGTAHYLSPEQAQGGRATPGSDVYALGLVGYECLSGHRAFDADSMVQVALMQISNTPEPLPADVPQAVRALIESATVKDPAQRFRDGAAFLAAIDDVLAGRPRRPTAPYAPYAPTAMLPAVPAAATAPFPATREMPAVTADPGLVEPDPVADEPAEGSRRRRLLIPLLALVVVAAIVLGGLQLIGGSRTRGAGTATIPTPPSTSSAPATSTAPATAPTTPTARLVDVPESDYVGRPVSEVQAELTARGLLVTLIPQQVTDAPDGEVTALDPVGALTPNTRVTVTYAMPLPPTPFPPPTMVPPPVRSVDDGSTSDSGPTSSGKSSDKDDDKGNGKHKDKDGD